MGLLERVKTNTMRYVGMMAEAADEAMPPPEGLPQADIFDRLLESVSWPGGSRVAQGCRFLAGSRGIAGAPPLRSTPSCAWPPHVCSVGGAEAAVAWLAYSLLSSDMLATAASFMPFLPL
jgi:hypothetical protein